MGGPRDGSCVPWASLFSLKNRSDYAAVANLRKRVVEALGADRERYEPVVLQGPNDGGAPETMLERLGRRGCRGAGRCRLPSR